MALVADALRLLPFGKRPAGLGVPLAEIDHEIRSTASLARMLELLDRSKPKLFDALRKHFSTPAESMAVTLKILNLSLAKFHFQRRSTTVLSRPLSLVVDPANACNLACPGCVHSENAKELKLFDWKPGMLGESRLAALLDRHGPYATQVTLCNYGEPLVNSLTPAFIRRAKGFFTRTMLSTNLALARFDAEAYANSGLDYMVLSIDGATQPVYEKFRRHGKIENVFSNVRKLVDAKRRARRSTPIIAWRYLAFEHNVHEIPAAIEQAEALGVDQFHADSAWDISWDDPNIRPAEIQSVRREFGIDSHVALTANWNPFPDPAAAELIEREFEKSWAAQGVGIEPELSNHSARPATTCEWLYKSITMDAGGRVFPCCCAPRPGADLHFANFDDGASADIFNSEKHSLARQFFADPQAYEAKRDAGGFGRGPYCARCEWAKVSEPERKQLRLYFSASAPDLWTSENLDLLAAWPSAE